MASFIKMATFAVILHIVFYVALNLVYVPDTSGSAGTNDWVNIGAQLDVFKFEPDLMDLIFANESEILANNIRDNWTSYNDVDTNLIAVPTKTGGEVFGSNVVSFLDAIGIIYATLYTILNIGAGPIAILSSNKINPIIWLLIGVPYLVIMWITILALIRGVGD